MKIRSYSIIIAAGTISSHAAITTVSTQTPLAVLPTVFFSDNGTPAGTDYFNVVKTVNSGDPLTGTFVDNSTYVSTGVEPIIGSLAGRDHDNQSTRPFTAQASWKLNLAGDAGAGTGFSNIIFSATLAANEGQWDNLAGEIDDIKFEVFLNSSAVAVATRTFKPTGIANTDNTSLALDTNGDGVGDGLAITTSGTGFMITNAGGAGITSIEVRASFTTNVSAESYWTFGTLSADYDMVPEPSSTLLFGLGGLTLLTRRSRNGHKS